MVSRTALRVTWMLQLVEDCETGFLAKSKRRTKERNQELQSNRAHQCHVEVVRVLCDDAHGKGERARDLKQTSQGGVNNMSCQHLQVLVRNLLQKQWEWPILHVILDSKLSSKQSLHVLFFFFSRWLLLAGIYSTCTA